MNDKKYKSQEVLNRVFNEETNTLATSGASGGGDASAANQVTGNVSLSSIDGKTPALGQALAAGSTPVVLPAAQITTLTPPAAITGFATETTLSSVNTKIPSQGQALAAASLPVVLPLAQNGVYPLESVPDSTAPSMLLATLNYNTGAMQPVLATDDSELFLGGVVPHDSADVGNPIKIGFKAYSPDGTTPGTAVTEGDRTDSKSDLDGRLFVNTTHPRRGHKHLDGSTAYTDESLVADPGDGFQVIITSIIVSTGAATAMNFFLEEGASKIFGPIYLEATAGRGFVSGPICLPVTASTAVTITTSQSIAQSIDVDYYIQAV